MVNVLFKAKRLDNDQYVTGYFTYEQTSPSCFSPVIQVIKEWDSGDYIESYQIDCDTLEQL